MSEMFNVNGKDYTEAELSEYLATKDYTNTPGWGVVGGARCCECGGSGRNVRSVLGVFVCFDCYPYSQKKRVKYCERCDGQRLHNAKGQCLYCIDNCLL